MDRLLGAPPSRSQRLLRSILGGGAVYFALFALVHVVLAFTSAGTNAWDLVSLVLVLVPQWVLIRRRTLDLPLRPSIVLAAIVDAAEEAMRNSLRHAGAANRTVHVRVAQGVVGIDVLDDGVGFDRAAVPPGRLGLSDSIEGRMRALEGGSAVIVSRPGVGTRVSLRWSADR